MSSLSRFSLMQTSELVELATIVARHGVAATSAAEQPSVRGLENYWTASKCRLDRWGRSLASLRRGEEPDFPDGFGSVRGLIEEILGSEILTRVWTASVASFDRHRKLQDGEVVARSVFIGQLEMRNRVLKLLIESPTIASVEAVELNRLRRRAELWTDLLLAPLGARHDVGEFAFETSRLEKFVADFSGASRGDVHDPAALVDVTIRTTAKHLFAAPSPNFDLNARVAAAILESYPAERFDSLGLLRSAWLVRMATTADDARRLVSEWIPEPRVESGAEVRYSRRFS